MAPCACNSGSKGNWKVYSSGGQLVQAFGSTPADEVRAKSQAASIGGTARQG